MLYLLRKYEENVKKLYGIIKDMGWRGNTYFYTKRTLRTIAENYNQIYEGLPLKGIETNPWRLAEYKADFDMALSGIGRGKWVGVNFSSFRSFGRLQQIVIADIMGIPDYELERREFYDIPRLRGFAYYLMTRFLNGGQ